MRFEVEDITAFDNEIGEALTAKVKVFISEESLSADILVFPTIPLDWDASLSELNQSFIDKAKSMLLIASS